MEIQSIFLLQLSRLNKYVHERPTTAHAALSVGRSSEVLSHLVIDVNNGSGRASKAFNTNDMEDDRKKEKFRKAWMNHMKNKMFIIQRYFKTIQDSKETEGKRNGFSIFQVLQISSMKV